RRVVHPAPPFREAELRPTASLGSRRGKARSYDCVVSALNRSVRVEADGSWVIPNVPAGSGAIRVRATCADQQGTRSGQSGLVEIPVDGAVEVEEISFDP